MPRARVHRRLPPRRQHPAQLRPPSPRYRPPPRRRPHIPRHRGSVRHRQPRDHPRPPQPRHPACRRAGALLARARRNRPRHRHPPHPNGGTTARTNRPPNRAANGPASQAQGRKTPDAAPRLGRSGTLHAHSRISIVRFAAAPSAAPSAKSAAISPSSPASAPPLSGTGYSRSCTTSAAASPT